MSWRRLIIAVLLVPIVVAGMFAWWVLAGEAGTRWSLGVAATRLPGLHLEGASGTWLEGIALRALTYDDGEGTRLQLADVSIRWSPAALLRGAVRIDALIARRLRLTLPPGDDAPWTPPDIRVPWPATVARLAVSELTVVRGAQQWRLIEVRAGGRIDRAHLLLTDLALQGEGLRLGGRAQIGTTAPHPVTATLDWELAMPDRAPLLGRLHLAGDLARLRVEQDLRGDLAAHVEGSVTPDYAGGRHRFDLRGHWSEWVVDLADGPLRSEQGEFTVAGAWPDYRLTLASRVSHPLAGQWQLHVQGAGDDQQLQVQAGEIDGAAGRLRFSGRLGWSPELTADLELQGRDIDPAAYLSHWPGSISLRGQLTGRTVDGKPSLALRIQRLDGSLRDYPVRAQGRVSYGDGLWRLGEVDLSSGANRARIDGSLAPRLALRVEVDAPRLEQVVPGMSGSLRGKGRVSGAAERLALQLDAQGSDMRFGDMQAAALSLQGELDPDDAARSRWRLQGAGIVVADRSLDEVVIDGTGNAAGHRFAGTLSSASLHARFDGRGALDGDAWSGELLGLDLEDARLGNWHLQAPASLGVGPRGQRIARSCLVQQDARLCAAGQRAADGSWRADADLADLPLSALQPWLAVDAAIGGRVRGQLTVQGRQAVIEAEGALQASPGEIRLRPEAGPELVTTHRDGEVRLHFAEDRLRAEGSWRLGETGVARGRIAVGGQQPAGRPLTGELSLDLADPRPLEVLLSQVSELAGPVQLRSTWSGTLRQPQVSLAGHWRQGRLTVPALGITLTQVDVRLDGDGDRLDLRGAARSEPGEVRLAGQLLLDAVAGWPLQLQVDGEDFTVAQRSDVEARVSPALVIRSRRGAIEAEGRLAVPYARVTGKELRRGAVRSSDDAVVVGMPDAADAPRPDDRLKVSADIQLVLGERVFLDAYGLTGRLTGGLRLYQKPGTAPEGSGQLNIVDGRYKAYGQDLTIDRGQLLFGGVLENPDVDVRAIRRIGDVTAGILLSGSLQAPTVQLYSDPVMDQAEALSYLVTGGPMGAGSVSPLMLAEAAAGFGIDKTGELAGQLAAGLGLDELKIESGANGLESSMMAIGKQLGPDLYLRYLYGLFDSAAAVQIRYRISERVRLEVEEGHQRAADVIYELETD